MNRHFFTRQRRALSSQKRKQLAKQSSRHLYKLHSILPRSYKHNVKVGLYYDSFGELPTQVILDWCQRLGYEPYLPVVDNSNKLRFSPIKHFKLNLLPTYLHPLGMRQHYHRISEEAEKLDIIFCPLVAIDKEGYRMGMGGGYYDRALSKSHIFGLTKPLKVAWCYDFQRIDCLDRQVWDVPMDIIITPTQFIRL